MNPVPHRLRGTVISFRGSCRIRGCGTTGVAYGKDAMVAGAVVDPRMRRLQVWRKQPGASYGDTATSLGAAVFTNGPMMGRSPARRRAW